VVTTNRKRIRPCCTPQNLLTWLQDPQAVKPESKMPRIPLPLQSQQQLVAYLEELK
jgi:cytochrome c1